MIKFDNVSKRYVDGKEALSEINFDISKGEMAFVTGHSGAGKSTLLKLILAIEKSSSGQLIVNDRCELRGDLLGVVEDDALGDLELEAPRVDVRLLRDPEDAIGETRLAKLLG